MRFRIIPIMVMIMVISSFFPIPMEAVPRDSISKRYAYETLRAAPDVVTVGDINKDDSPEILFASTDLKIVVLYEDFSQGPVKQTNSIVREILISDLDEDSYREVIAIDSTTLYIFDKDLGLRFKHIFEEEVFDIAVGNLDDDELDELLVGTGCGLYVFNWNDSKYEIKSYIENKSISEVMLFVIEENKKPYVIARNNTDILIRTYNGGPLEELKYKEILEIGYLGDHLIILGKKNDQSEPTLWKFPLAGKIDKKNETNFYKQYPIREIFFAHYEESDLLTAYIHNFRSLVSISLNGEEIWDLSIHPVSVELFDLDNFEVKDYGNENYDEIVIAGAKKISVYIYCWRKIQPGEYETEMKLVEEYEIVENIEGARTFDSSTSWGKYVLIVTNEGKLVLYEIFNNYNWFVRNYKEALNAVDYAIALDNLDFCIKRFEEIAEYYGIVDDINEKRQICLDELGKDKGRIDQLMEEGLGCYDEGNYKAAAENLSQAYAFYDLMNTEDDEIIYKDYTFSELRVTLQQIMAELVVETEGYYSKQNYLLALENLSYLEEAIGESRLGIDREKIPETMENFIYPEERQKIFDNCINQLGVQAESYENNNQLEDALKVWKTIEEAYLRLGYDEDEYQFEHVMKPVLDEIANIETKISQEKRENSIMLFIILTISISIILAVYFEKYCEEEKKKKIKVKMELIGKILLREIFPKLREYEELFTSEKSVDETQNTFMQRNEQGPFKYDVALSFAGEDRDYVEEIAEKLKSKGIKVFYDAYEQAEMWGKDLYEHLDEIYRKEAKYCVIFVSKYYAQKLWTNHERKSAQARAFQEQREYILPARFDGTEIPGIRPTIAYIDLRKVSQDEFVELVIKKLED